MTHLDEADISVVLFLEDGNFDVEVRQGMIERRFYKSGSVLFFTGAVHHRGAGYNENAPDSRRIYMYLDRQKVLAGASTEFLHPESAATDYLLHVDSVVDSVWQAIVTCYSSADEY